MASVSHLAPIHLGLDVHNDTISVGILDPDQQVPDVDRITHDEPSVRRLVARFPDRAQLRACSQHRPDRLRAGPAAAQPARALRGDRSVADPPGTRRQGPRPTGGTAAGSPRLHRAGELVAIRIPSPAEEAVRDLCRTRADMVCDLTRARNRLGKFQLAPWAALAGRVDPNPRLPGVAALPARPARDDPDVSPRPGRGRGPQPGAGRRGGRPGRLVRAATVGLAGRPAGRLPGRDPAGRAHLGRRGLRLAPLCHRERVHGVLRAGPKRVFQRQLGPPRPAHQGRQRAPARAAGGVGLVLPAPPLGRCGDRPPPARPRPGGRRPRVGGAAAPVGPLCAPWPPASTPTASSPRPSRGSSSGSGGPR